MSHRCEDWIWGLKREKGKKRVSERPLLRSGHRPHERLTAHTYARRCKTPPRDRAGLVGDSKFRTISGKLAASLRRRRRLLPLRAPPRRHRRGRLLSGQ